MKIVSKKKRVKRSDIIVKVIADKPTRCGNVFSEQVLEAIHNNNKNITKFDKEKKTLTLGKKALFLLINGVAAVDSYNEATFNK